MQAAPLRKTFINDFNASLTIFILGLPIAMGVALASGTPIDSGLIAAVVGGLVVGTLGGAPLQVSGPVVGLAVLVFDITSHYGFASMCAVTVAAGLIQLLFGAARLGRWAAKIPQPMLQGMMSGVGMQVVLSQMHIMLGDRPRSSTWQNLLTVPQLFTSPKPGVAALGILTLGVLCAWPHLRALKRIPPSLAAIAMVTGIAWAADLHVPRAHLPAHLGHFMAPHAGTLPWGLLLRSALGVALIVSLHSLLSALAMDKQHNGPRVQVNRELVAQGVANIVSGLLGGLPVSGVILRSHANMEAGARTRMSTILHGVWTLGAVLLFRELLEQIPLAALAALFFLVGWKLMRLRDIPVLHRQGNFAVYAATAAGVFAVDLIVGLSAGLVAELLVRGTKRERKELHEKLHLECLTSHGRRHGEHQAGAASD